MNSKSFKVLISGFIVVQVLLLIFSWLAWYQASQEPGLVYQPLKSYLLPFEVEEGSKFFDLPSWMLAVKKLKPAFNYKLIHEITMWVLVAFYSFFLIFALTKKKILEQTSIKCITTASLIIGSICCFMIPADSSDLFSYVARGAQQTTYKQNPYQDTINTITTNDVFTRSPKLLYSDDDIPKYKNLDELKDFLLNESEGDKQNQKQERSELQKKFLKNWRLDPQLANTHWQRNPAPYGPLFMYICKNITDISKGSLWTAMLFFKLLNFLCFGLLIFMVHKIINLKDSSGNILCSEETQKHIYFLAALNPFIIVETLWNGHNDILMAAFILIGVYLAFRNKFNLAIVSITVAGLFKYLSFILLPIFFIFAIKKGLRYFPLVGIIIATGLCAFAIQHYSLPSIDYSEISSNLTLSHKSLFDMFNSLYKYISREDLPSTFKNIFLALFAAVYLWILFKLLKLPKPEQEETQALAFTSPVFKYSFYALFILISLLSPKFHSWYILIYLPIGLFAEPILMFYMSISHLLSMTLLDQVNIANFLLMTALPIGLYYIKTRKSEP